MALRQTGTTARIIVVAMLVAPTAEVIAAADTEAEPRDGCVWVDVSILGRAA